MAIRPVDLQLAYLAAPQNAAQVNNAQTAPQVAQQAAQAAFAAELHRREETIEETTRAEGTQLRTNPDGERDARDAYEQQEQHRAHDDGGSPLGLAGDGEHFIDITC